MTDLQTARRNRRRNQYRAPKVVVALTLFRNGVKDLDLSQREHRACLARIERAASPEHEAQELLGRYLKARGPKAGTELAPALNTIEACPAFRKRGTQRQDTIRRVVRAADSEHGRALMCAERIVTGDQWLGMNWLPEVKGRVRRLAAERGPSLARAA